MAPHRRDAFTLVELLAVIAVVSVLITLSVGALAGARNRAREVECRAILRSIGEGVALHARDNAGYWPNAFRDAMDETYKFFHGSRGNAWLTSYWAQVRTWSTALIGTYFDAGDPAAVWTCPEVRRSAPRGYADAPFLAAMSSYYESATLISDNALWDPDDRTAMRYIDEHRRRVPLSAVVFPSAKATIAEIADYHAPNPRIASDPLVAHLNTLLADGSATRVPIARVVPSLETRNMFHSDGVFYSIPFVGTPHGVAGLDLP